MGALPRRILQSIGSRQAGWRRARALGLLAAALGALLYGVEGARSAPPSAPIDRALTPVSPARAAGERLRLVAFGTSLTAHYDWPDALAAALERCRGAPVRMERIAMGGADTAWALAALPRVLAAAPDVILIEFAVNDADLRRRTGLATSRARHLALVDTVRAALPETRIVLMTMSPATGFKRLLRPRLPAYNAMLHALARAEGLGLADLAPRWHGVTLPDGVHPRPEDAARIIVPPLTALLGASLGRACAAL